MEFSTLRAWLTLSFTIYDLKFENTISWSTTYQSTLDWSAALPPLSFICSSVFTMFITEGFFPVDKNVQNKAKNTACQHPFKKQSLPLCGLLFTVLKNSG